MQLTPNPQKENSFKRCILFISSTINPKMFLLSYKKDSIQIVYREALPSMEMCHSLRLNMARTILQSSLKQEVVNNNVEVCRNFKWSMKGFWIFCSALEKTTWCVDC